MGWPKCNSTLENEELSEIPIWHGHTFHTLGLELSGIFTIVAIVVSCSLIFLHATHYSRPQEQRHIIRILFMVPVYAAVSLLSFYFYRHSVYFEVMGDCYEAFAIASFFSLMCAYIAQDLHRQKEYFRTITPRNWVWPLPWLQRCSGGEHAGIWRVPRSGLTWFNIIWVCIFQYCFIRVSMTIVSVITQAVGLYCLESLNPAFSHIWVLVIEAISVTIAMYCVIQFYIQIRQDIHRHKPLLKVLAIKLVIFLSFWQTMVISLLTSTGVISTSDKIQTPDIKVGIPSMLLCIEMALFAIFHFWAFSFMPYRIDSKTNSSDRVPGEEPLRYQGGFLGIRAFIDSMNPWDMIKATARAGKWLFRDRKNRHLDVSYDLSRQESRGSDTKAGVPKPGLSAGGAAGAEQYDVSPTAYRSRSPRPPHYGGGDPIEGQTLLANQQVMGVVSRPGDLSPTSPTSPTSPPRQQPSSSPMRGRHRPMPSTDERDYVLGRGRDDDDADDDIGVATTTAKFEPAPRYYQAYHPYQEEQNQVTAVGSDPDLERGRSHPPVHGAGGPAVSTRRDGLF